MLAFFFHKCTYFMTSIEFVFFNSTITSQKINIVLDYPISKGLMALPVQNRYGADDRQEVEDEVQGLRQRRVESDEIKDLGLVAVGQHEDLEILK